MKDPRDPGYLQRRQPPPGNRWDFPVPKFATAPAVARIPVHAPKNASHASAKTPLAGGATKFSRLEAAARDLSTETDATTSSSHGQPTEVSRELTSTRSTQVDGEDLPRPLRGFFVLGRLRGPEEKGKEEEHREEETKGTRPPICGNQALTRRYPGSDQSAWRRTPGPRINGPTPPPTKPPSPPTNIATHHPKTRVITCLKCIKFGFLKFGKWYGK